MPPCWAMAAPAPAKAMTVSPSRNFLIMIFSLWREISRAGGAGKARETHWPAPVATRRAPQINVYLRRNAAAEKRHQRPTQRVRPSGSENQLGTGLIDFAAGRLKQIRNAPGNGGGRIHPVPRPRRHAHN